MKQQTLANSFTLEGKGLHTGLNIRLTFLPAAENTGICIKRVDLPGQPCYEATSDLVSSTQRGTVLEKGEWKISTIEHAMAALSAADIDNCLIEVNAPEFPIMDGSAVWCNRKKNVMYLWFANALNMFRPTENLK